MLAGFKTIHCNTHYLSQVVSNELSAALKKSSFPSNSIRFWYEKNILETGGGIARIYHELCKEDKANLEKDLIVVSGDIIADFPLTDMLSRWNFKDSDTLALMCTKKLLEDRKDATLVSIDERYVIGFGQQDIDNKNPIPFQKRLFSNHQIISGSVVTECQIEKKSSINLIYKKILGQEKNIENLIFDETRYWFNVGTEHEYLDALAYFRGQNKSKHFENKMHDSPIDLKNEVSLNKNHELNRMLQSLSIRI